jgi:hypothetical protein
LGDAFAAVYVRLKGILEPYAPGMHVSADTATTYGLDLRPRGANPGDMVRGGPPGQALRELLPDAGLRGPAAARGRLARPAEADAGQVLLNLTKVDDGLISELTDLTKRGYDRTAGDAEWGKRIRANWDKARSNR